MTLDVTLSPQTIAVLARIKTRGDVPDCFSGYEDAPAQVSINDLLAWMNEDHRQVTGRTRFQLESLQAACLADLNKTLAIEEEEDKTKKRNWRAIAKLVFLAFLGLIYFSAEGFDGIASMLLGISSLSNVYVFIIGVVFAVAWASLFFAVHLMEIADNLGVNMFDAPRMINIYTNQVEQIKALRKKLSKQYDEDDEEKLQHDLAILHMLQNRMTVLNSARDALKASLNNRFLVVAKYGMALMAGAILFCGGFMAGQTVALAFATLFVASISPTAWPIVLFCVVIGLAAFGFYWFVERGGIENLIGRCIGLDKTKVDAFCNQELVEKENKKQEHLERRITRRAGELQEKKELRARNEVLEERVRVLESHMPVDLTRQEPVYSSPSSFFSPSSSRRSEAFSVVWEDLEHEPSVPQPVGPGTNDHHPTSPKSP